jgi:hypothetical protein
MATSQATPRAQQRALAARLARTPDALVLARLKMLLLRLQDATQQADEQGAHHLDADTGGLFLAAPAPSNGASRPASAARHTRPQSAASTSSRPDSRGSRARSKVSDVSISGAPLAQAAAPHSAEALLDELDGMLA